MAIRAKISGIVLEVYEKEFGRGDKAEKCLCALVYQGSGERQNLEIKAIPNGGAIIEGEKIEDIPVILSPWANDRGSAFVSVRYDGK